jgi:hypothetical protein
MKTAYLVVQNLLSPKKKAGKLIGLFYFFCFSFSRPFIVQPNGWTYFAGH